MTPLVAVPTPIVDIPDRVLTSEEMSALTNQQVTDEITTWAGRVAAGEARLLAYIGEFDKRQAWSGVGILSCAHWLAWRLGMGSKTASERVRVARVLLTLPLTAREFAAGRLSFTQVRAITRTATPEDEETYVSIARHASGGQLERLARGIRRARKLAEREKELAEARARNDVPPPRLPRLTIAYELDGDMRITLRASAPDAAVLLAAVEAAQADLDTASRSAPQPSASDAPTKRRSNSSAEESGGPTEAPVRRTTPGEALIELSRVYLRQRAVVHPKRARRDRSRLTLQVDPLSGWARLPDGEVLAPAVMGGAGLSLPGGIGLRGLRPADLKRFDAGRSQREASQSLRDLLGTVDGERCRFPGCSRRRRLHAHHVVPWAKGGRTDLANLVLQCSRHHTLVHARGFRLALHPTRRTLIVTTRKGAAIKHRQPPPWRPAGELDPHRLIGPKTLPPTVLDRLDLHYAVSVLLQHAA